MADGTITLPPDSTGKILDTSSLLVGANTVQRERINIADPTGATALAAVENAQPGASDFGLVVRPVNLAQASTTAGQTGALVQGAVTTAAPTYVTAQTDPLSLTTTGALRVNDTQLVGQASTSAGQLGPLVQGAVTTAAPTYVTAQTDPLSLTTTGALRTNDTQLVAQASTTAGQLGPLVQGAVITANPTYTTAQTDPLSITTNGAVRACIAAGTGLPTNNQTAALSVFAGNSTTALAPFAVAPMGYGGAFSGAANAALQGYSRGCTPVLYKTLSATASGNTAIWTPGAGNKFRLLKFWIGFSQNVNVAAGGVVTVKFQDAAVDIGLSFDCFVPTTAVTTNPGEISTGLIDMGSFGYVSAAANQTLNVNLSATLTTGACRVTVMGVEE